MNLTQDKKFLICLGAAALLGTTYWAVNYLSSIKTTNAKPLSLQKTKKILQEIKYQILTTCTTFVEGTKIKPKTNHSQQDLEIFYRSELAKVYELRQDNSLNKYIVTRDQYASSLNHYKNDPQIKKGQQEIIEMLERATKGIYPNFTVSQQAKNLLTQEQVVQVYLEMCELISVKVWQKLEQQTRLNPGFNSKDDSHFKKAVRQLSIYDIKVEFLKKKGFETIWGCPNEVFFKVMESLKQENNQIKNKAAAIDKAYEKVLDKITKQAENLNAERIKFLFEESLNEKAREKSVAQVLPNNKAPLVNSVQSPPKKVVIAQKDDDFNMDELMMRQLMSRSQEEPKQEKIEVPKEEPIKIVEIQASKKEQKEELIAQVKIAQQIAVPITAEVIPAQVQVEKVVNEGNEGVAEENHTTVVVQFQQKAQQIKIQSSIQEVKQEEAKQEEEKVQAQQAQEVLAVEQPEPRQE